MKKKKIKKSLFLSRWLALAAAALYCSWPLGYFLNPMVSAHGLASELAAVGQPYNWVFISGDVISGAIIVVVAALLWYGLSAGKRDTWVWATILNFGLFGFFTMLDASLPMKCTPSTQLCPTLGHDPFLILHGIASISAAVCLCISAYLLWQVNRHHVLSPLMMAVMIGWIAFGLVSIVFFFIPGPGYLAQHYFITLCSLWTALLPVVILQAAGGRHRYKFHFALAK